MSPKHKQLALSECADFLQQDLIEPSSSPWACEAFYVNKRSEQIRALFTNLSRAKVFSKFDLKAEFWQLGIHLEDKAKIGFYIPNAYYQWEIMPFGHKTTSSLLQKAMCRIFSPIMDQALVYIDDILLSSPTEEAHKHPA
ncbi:hypothetical protein CRG98_013336 [Punica granatum]|uniref:Reverse transcriptase domain-containing protein n=1 Tax=Punica granatum TaxID=22663 RepID=A0A2I0KCI9_PUNGR|nr:hypothetical protein CRG98_013336 [Punica granatum]